MQMSALRKSGIAHLARRAAPPAAAAAPRKKRRHQSWTGRGSSLQRRQRHHCRQAAAPAAPPFGRIRPRLRSGDPALAIRRRLGLNGAPGASSRVVMGREGRAVVGGKLGMLNMDAAANRAYTGAPGSPHLNCIGREQRAALGPPCKGPGGAWPGLSGTQPPRPLGAAAAQPTWVSGDAGAWAGRAPGRLAPLLEGAAV